MKHRPLILGVVALTILSACSGSGGQTARQAEVEARGAKVMPFDQTRTTHIFRKTPEGGVQSVVAKNANDSRQIRLVREHLRREASAFPRGDFEDPMAIHGMQMPGIGTLRAGASQIEVTYATIPRGSRVSYVTTEPSLVAALHDWFDAQVMDHGTNAHG